MLNNKKTRHNVYTTFTKSYLNVINSLVVIIFCY